jgi:hypothetical protein
VSGFRHSQAPRHTGPSNAKWAGERRSAPLSTKRPRRMERPTQPLKRKTELTAPNNPSTPVSRLVRRSRPLSIFSSNAGLGSAG